MSVASSALQRDVTVFVWGKFSGELLPNMVIVCNNLCEEVDSLLAVEVAIAEEGSARAREAHHRQRHRDRHVHLVGGPFVCWYLFVIALVKYKEWKILAPLVL